MTLLIVYVIIGILVMIVAEEQTHHATYRDPAGRKDAFVGFLLIMEVVLWPILAVLILRRFTVQRHQ